MSTAANNKPDNSSNIVVSKIKEYLTPGLLAILSFFVKNWMNEVDDKLNQLTALQTQVTAIAVKVDRNKDDIAQMQSKIFSFSDAIKEDEITLESLQRKHN